MKPTTTWMLIACVFVLGFYVGRVTLSRFYIDIFIVFLWLINCAVWGSLRYRETRGQIRRSREIIEEIRRNYGG